jgi:hypothetical protein
MKKHDRMIESKRKWSLAVWVSADVGACLRVGIDCFYRLGCYVARDLFIESFDAALIHIDMGCMRRSTEYPAMDKPRCDHIGHGKRIGWNC